MIQISVVVPVYGVEQWIERCVRSLMEQTKTDGVEFIFVDDSTPDRSIEVLQRVLLEYPERSGQVRILHHSENRGLPQARKTGIESAGGQYILNVDSDDWLDLNTLSILSAKVAESSPDIITFDYACSDGQSNGKPVCQRYDSRKLLGEMIRSKCKCSVCNKLIKRDLFLLPEPIEFPIIYMAEDMFICCQIATRANSVVHIPQVLYYYFTNPDSRKYRIDNEKAISGANQMMTNVDRLIDILGSSISANERDFLKLKTKVMLRPIVKSRSGLKKYKNLYHEINYRVFFNRAVPLKTRLRHLFSMIGI